jgi:hypothetical protein
MSHSLPHKTLVKLAGRSGRFENTARQTQLGHLETLTDFEIILKIIV